MLANPSVAFGAEFQATRSVRHAIIVIAAAALTYGGAMGSSGDMLFSRPLQVVYSAIKLPMLLGATFVISLPSFFVINSVVGVRGDFARVLRALLASQAA